MDNTVVSFFASSKKMQRKIVDNIYKSYYTYPITEICKCKGLYEKDY